MPPAELLPSFAPRPRAAHAVFDFDGTLSILREGWPEVMVGLVADHLPLRPGEDAGAVQDALLGEVLALAGKESIHQLLLLRERVRERGGGARPAEWYAGEFVRRLTERSAARVDALRSGANPDRFLVRGSRRLLAELRDAGLTLHLVSGTPEEAVRREAELLGLAPFFAGRVHGPRDGSRTFSKRAVIDGILAEYAATGDALISFGDGPVEIEETKAVGGLAVAVASDEADPDSGRADPRKRARLLAAGADAVVADYTDTGLADLLLGR